MRRAFPIACLALAACSSPSSSGDRDKTDETGETGEQPEGVSDEPLAPLGPRPNTQTCRVEGTAAGAVPRLEAEVIDGPNFSDAIQIIADPNAGLWVVEASGRVWSIDPADEQAGDPTPKLVVDLSERVDCCASRGLLAVALAPGPDPSALFVHYHRASDPNKTRLARLSFDAAAGVADPESELLVLEVNHPTTTAASGGGLAFDASGMLLVGVGDDSVEPPANPSDSPARDRMDLRGSILRLDVSGPGPGYAIPPDNPFVGDPEARPELFATGFHDPRACTTDLDGGRSWCSDSGTGVREEIDALIPGADFGWPIVEGLRCSFGECDSAIYAGPHADYSVDDPEAGHCRVSAALGYRGADLSEQLLGVQVFGDRCSGRLWGLRADVGAGAFEVIGAIDGGIAALGPDASGEPWIVGGDGRLARLIVASDGEPGTLATTLGELDCFAELAPLEPAPELIPYLVTSALWSDALFKKRHMVIPPGEHVVVGEHGRWSFPEGSVLIKTFILEAVPGEPASRRPIETRFMVRRRGVWEFHSYRWLEDGSDAVLLDDGETVTLRVEDPEGPWEFEWSFPDQLACRTCHGFAGGVPLGPTTAQMNRDVRYGEAEIEPQLSALISIDLLEFEAGATPDPASLPALVDPRDQDAPLADRARAYMHANCAHCHQPSWMRPDLRYSTPLAETGVCEPSEFPSPWVSGVARVVPGAPEQSNLWLRMGTRGPGQMPAIGTAVVDPLGLELVHDWIAGLEEGCL